MQEIARLKGQKRPRLELVGQAVYMIESAKISLLLTGAEKLRVVSTQGTLEVLTKDIKQLTIEPDDSYSERVCEIHPPVKPQKNRRKNGKAEKQK